MLKLGVNVDHVATLREARKASLPSPLEAALIAEKSGADTITAHLREDRRHIQDKDLEELAKNVKSLNMEMAITEEMLRIASKLKPHQCCLVPERRQELTTEGGLNLLKNKEKNKNAISRLKDAGIIVSLFIDPDQNQIESAAELGAQFIELHTGSFANASPERKKIELQKLINSAIFANKIGLGVNAGHGIDYINIHDILKIPHLNELNIGHSIIAKSIITGISKAVREMKNIMKKYKSYN